MPEDPPPSPSISRRVVIGAAATLPGAAAMPATGREGYIDGLAARCAEWLALDLEIDRLSLRWSALEVQAARELDWFKLSHEQRAALPMAAEMRAIDERLSLLFKARTRGLKALRGRKPRSLHEATSKLVVAARVGQYDGGDVHTFIVQAIDALNTLTCAACGAPHAPPVARRA